MQKKLFWLITTALLAALVFSGMVFAEGEEPPTVPAEEPAAVVETAPAAEEPAAEVPVVEEEAPTDPTSIEEAVTLAVEEPAAVVEAATADPAPVEDVTAPAVEEAVITEEPILADVSGEPLDLASQESANLISNGDPYWFVGPQKYATIFVGGTCPDGTTYGLTCWDDIINDDPINLALEIIETGLLPTDRKLYIVGGTAYNEDIDIDAGSIIDYYKSQLNGFLGIPDSSGDYPILNGYIFLTEMSGGFTLSNITINNGYFSLKDSAGTVMVKDVTVENTSGSGIEIGDETGGVYTRHKGSVTLQKVKANDNSGSGAEIYTTGNTKISNSAFNFNGVDGLKMNILGGTILMNGFSAIGNQNNNMIIENYQKALIVTNAVLNGSQNASGLTAVSSNNASVTLNTIIANDNDNYGIYLQTGGAMTLTNVEASYSVNNPGMILNHSDGTALVKVTNSRFFDNGLLGSGSGLEIYSLGNVLLTSINSSGNQYDGLLVDNCLYTVSACRGSGTVTVTSPATGGFMAASYFQGNGSSGIEIVSKSNVSLNNFKSTNNSVFGVDIYNAYVTGNIIINTTLPYWTNAADGNVDNGIYLRTKGNISLSNTSASGNGGYGFFCTANAKDVLISASDFSSNTLYGLDITSIGAIAVSKTNANENGDYGIWLNNSGASTAQTVTISSSNAYLNKYGIYVSTKGSTEFVSVSASDNDYYGVRVVGGSTDANFTLYGSGSYFNDNGTIGLDVDTYGAIALTNVSATGNGSQGLKLSNNHFAATGDVSIVSSGGFWNTITGNGLTGVDKTGLEVITRGAITLMRVDASYNKDYGALLNNLNAATTKYLILTNCTFESNVNTGLFTDIRGPIIAYGLRASYNLGHGADLNNSHGEVIITSYGRVSRFLGNNGQGLDIFSTGAVTLSNIMADLNGVNGVIVVNNGDVTVSGTHPAHATSFSGNGSDGLDIYTLGTITIDSTILANGNIGTGIYLHNQSASSAKTIMVSYTETNNNGGKGLWIEGNSIVNLANLESQSNGNSGVYVINDAGDSGLVTVSGKSLIASNSFRGLEIHTPLAANVSGVTTEFNTLSGIYIESALGTTKVTNSKTRQNLYHGIEITATNNVLLNGVKCISNGNMITDGDGVWINSHNFNVIIRSSVFIGNYGNGIDAEIGTGVSSLTDSKYFGNDADNDGNQDLYWH